MPVFIEVISASKYISMKFDPLSLCAAHIKKIIEGNHSISNSYDFEDKVRLNANENALGSPIIKWYNRFPLTDNIKLKAAVAHVKKTSPENIFISNGSSLLFDIFIRTFCNPGNDNIIVCPPNESFVEKNALLCNVEIRKAPLLQDFQLDLVHIESLADKQTKIIFISSPNNPTGNAMDRKDIELILNNFDGLVVLDESYVNFSKQKSFLAELDDYPNLIVLHNFDIAWGLAGLQVAMFFASVSVIQLLKIVNCSFGINTPTEELLLKALEEVGMVNDMIKELVQMRAALKRVLEKFPFIVTVYPSDANFLLVKMTEAEKVFDFLLQKEILVKNVSDQVNCENCLRITVGTEEENTKLIEGLVEYYDLSKQ